MDALDLLVDFASFLASSTTVPRAANAGLDAQSVKPLHSTNRQEQPANVPISIEQASYFTMDGKATSAQQIPPTEAMPPRATQSKQLGGSNEEPRLNMYPMLIYGGRPDGPGKYVEPYAVGHTTNVWNPREHLDKRQEPHMWMNTHGFNGSVQPEKLTWAPSPLFQAVPSVDGMGRKVVAGDGEYQSHCRMGICNCPRFPPGFADSIPPPSYAQCDTGIPFGDNARKPPIDLSMQWD